MSARLVPAYVERPAWAVYRAYCEMMSEDGNDDTPDHFEGNVGANIAGGRHEASRDD